MAVTLVLPSRIANELFGALSIDIESACVLLARQVETPGGNVRLLARSLHWVPDDATCGAMQHGSVFPPTDTCLHLVRRRPISLFRSGCTRILGARHLPDQANMMNLWTNSLLTFSAFVQEAPYTEQLSSPGLEDALALLDMSNPKTSEMILIAYG